MLMQFDSISNPHRSEQDCRGMQNLAQNSKLLAQNPKLWQSQIYLDISHMY